MDENILAYGFARGHRDQFLIGSGIALLVLALLAWLGWSWLHATFAIPDRTAVLVSVSPRSAARLLDASARSRWPEPWQIALTGASRVSVILGAARAADGRWQTFALLPRWREVAVPSDLRVERKKLVTLIADGGAVPGSETVTFTDQWGWWKTRWNADAVFRVDPTALFDLSASSAAPILLSLKDRVLQSDLPFQTQGAGLPLIRADVSLNLPDQPSDQILSLASSLRVGELDASALSPRPTQINLNLDQRQKTEAALLIFPQDVADEQARQLMAGFGLGQRTSVKLADGTVVYETRLFQDGLGRSGTPEPSAYGNVTLSGRELRLDRNTQPADFSAIPSACPSQAIPWLRLSPKSLETLINRINPDASSTMPGLQFASLDQKLIVCMEN